MRSYIYLLNHTSHHGVSQKYLFVYFARIFISEVSKDRTVRYVSRSFLCDVFRLLSSIDTVRSVAGQKKK